MKLAVILCIGPDRRKAPGVKACLEGPMSPMAPAIRFARPPEYNDLFGR
jgi:hypothetical protein